MDTLTPKERSELMGRIRGGNTKPEMAVRSLLHHLGYRFRVHGKALPGRPDIVLPRFKAVIFVHGCFWHRHRRCANTRMPKSRLDFWARKFEMTVRRDRQVRLLLRQLGWKYTIVWECETGDLAALARRLREFLKGTRSARWSANGKALLVAGRGRIRARRRRPAR